MQKITIGIALALSLVATGSMARDKKDTARELTQATKNALKTYKTGGVSGLIIDAQECWEKGVRPYCLYVDMSGQLVDALMADAIKAPANEFFDHGKVIERATPLLINMGLNENTAPEYMQAVGEAVSDAMRRQLVK